MSTLQTPTVNPVASIAGELYECRASFKNSRKYWKQKPVDRYPIIEITADSDEETKSKAADNTIARNLILACCFAGKTAEDGKWTPIEAPPTAEGYYDWEWLQDQLMAPEYTALTDALNEAWRLAGESVTKAQALTPKTKEPTPIAA